MECGAISRASPRDSGCKWEHGTTRQATASQNPFKDETWVQKEQSPQVLDFTGTTSPVGLADFLLTNWAYLADCPQQGGANLLFVRNVQLQRRTRGWPLLTRRGLALAQVKSEKQLWKTCPMKTAYS